MAAFTPSTTSTTQLPAPPSVISAMAAHVNIEEQASRMYRQLSAWCERESWVGCAEFFRKEASEEYGHAQAFQDYVLDRRGMVMLGTQYAMTDADLPGGWQNLVECFRSSLAVEEEVLANVNAMAGRAIEVGDLDAVRFLQKYSEIGVSSIRDLDVWIDTLTRASGDIAAMQAFDCRMGG
jgi:ferritin